MSEDLKISDFTDANDSESTTQEGVSKPTRWGKIPPDWGEKTIREVTELVTDGSHNPPKRVEEGIQIISSQNIQNGYIDFEKEPSYISPSDFEQMDNNHSLREGDLLMTIVGSIGRSAIVGDKTDFALQRSVALIRTNDEVEPLFLKFVTDTGRFHRQAESRSRATAQGGLYLEALNKIKLPVPSLSEQRKIATVLYTVDQAIQKTEEIRERAKSVEEVLKTEFFTRGYSEWELDGAVGLRCRANQFPKEWEVKPAEELMEITRGASPRPRSDDSLFGGDIPWIKIGDAERGISKRIEEVDSYVTKKGKKKSKLVEEGTLLVANSGATCGFAVFAGVDGCVHDGWLILRDYNGFVPDFLYHYINWNYEYLQSLSLGSAQTNLSTSLFGRLDIPIPPIQEQRKIVEALDSINKIAFHNSKETDWLKRLKRGLMQDLLSGTVRTTDTNIEVPEEIAQYG